LKGNNVESYIYLREPHAVNLFNVSRISIQAWVNKGLLKREKRGHLSYFIAKLVVDENGDVMVELFPEPQPEPVRAKLNVKFKR
jgi:hypothetical protein